MSLWMQTATELLCQRQYEKFRKDLLPCAPFTLPESLLRELEFGERCCRDKVSDPLFPIRFMWFFEGHEQQQFGIQALGRSRYHPELLLVGIYERVSADSLYRQELETEGFLFNLEEKAVAMSTGWILIGERFVEDLFEIEATLGFEILFPDSQTGELRPAFQSRRCMAAKTMNSAAVEAMGIKFKPHFDQLSFLQVQIRDELNKYADGKHLKGYELVGWLGEIYVKLLLNGKLVHDKHEHDVETDDGRRISIKARKGRGSGWQQTSSIPKFEGADCPTHLAFVHLLEDYSLDRIWLFDWHHLCSNNRFSRHVVRGNHRSYVFKLDEKRDAEFVVYDAGVK